MSRGLVLGKFAPLHRGHQLLIERSLAECDQTVVLVYDSPQVTRIPLGTRAGWIRQLYPQAQVIEGTKAPAQTGRDPAVMRLQEEYIRIVVPGAVTHFFSSEWYGAHVSQALVAVDVRVDEARSAMPISGTSLREDAWQHRAFVDPVVYRDLIRWVVLVGAESTGKSTLSRALAEEFQTVDLQEPGRDYWTKYRAQDGTLSLSQLAELAQQHRESEEKAAGQARRLLFIDTEARTTRQYALWYHGTSHPKIERLAAQAKDRYHLTVLCGDDIPYVEDGTRAGESRRRTVQAEWRDMLRAEGGEWIEVTGTVANRIRTVQREIARLGLTDWC